MPISRCHALQIIAAEFADAPVVFTCGATSREMAALGRRPNHLYVVDSMGLVSSILLGLSLGLEDTGLGNWGIGPGLAPPAEGSAAMASGPAVGSDAVRSEVTGSDAVGADAVGYNAVGSRGVVSGAVESGVVGAKVVGVEGDGGMLMNLNALTSIGYLQPRNLLLIVLDNRQYASTGGQATFTTHLDLADIAESCQLKVWRADDLETLRQSLTEAAVAPGPAFIRMRIAPGNAENIPLLLDDPVTLGHSFTQWLQSAGIPSPAEAGTGIGI